MGHPWVWRIVKAGTLYWAGQSAGTGRGNESGQSIKTFPRKTFCIPDIPLRDADATGDKTIAEKSHVRRQRDQEN